jgi:hypothetical protein
MIKTLTALVLISCVYLAYKNFVEGSQAEHIAVQAIDVGKQTVYLGQDGLDKVNDKVHKVMTP